MKLLLFFFSCFSVLIPPDQGGWEIFARVKFSPQLIKDVNEYFLVPSFDSGIRLHEGKEITLEGFFIPMDLSEKKTIIVSKNPYAECFFCGGAGPESVAEVRLASAPPRLKADARIRVTGTLRLNSRDINHMNFILENARLELSKK